MHSTRRNFLKTTGCLTIGFCFGAHAYAPAALTPGIAFAPPDQNNINAWLEILAEGRVRVLTGKLELGQGIRTAVAQVAAEELDMDMNQVEVLLAETGRTPNEGYTAGSGSIENSAMAIRNAAAAARQKLLGLAAEKMKKPVSELTIAKGKITHENSKDVLTLAEVLGGKQLTDEVRLPLKFKAKDAYRLVGKAIPRDDISHMVKGEPVYVQDLRFPGMVHARIVRPPAYGATLLQYNQQAVLQKNPGLLKTVVNGSFLAVIADDEFEAIKAQKMLSETCRWSTGTALPKLKSTQLADYIKTLPVQTQRVTEKGNAAIPKDKQVLKARYFKPYIMHGSIGPSCAVAIYENNKLDIYSHSQGVYPLRDAIAKMLNMPDENIHVIGVPGSGCYGHNGADDVAAEAALLAVAYPGKHIRLQWSRQDEHNWEPYGTAMNMEVEAHLDESGKISHWKYELWSDIHGNRPAGNAESLLPARYLEKPFAAKATGYSGGASRNSEPYYSIPNQEVYAHFFNGPLRVSSLRGLGAYANIFAIESFMDELAEKAGKDPYEFRLLHLEDERAKAVVQKLKLLTQGLQNENTGIGIAFSRYKNSAAYCAVAAQVALDTKSKEPKILKMWAAIDAGEIINLDGIKNQTEGGMIQSASWTMQEQVMFDEKHVTAHNWDAYPIFRFSQVPAVEVAVIDRPDQEPLGAGEAAQGPAAAAIANAYYRASGKRVRYLPLLQYRENSR